MSGNQQERGNKKERERERERERETSYKFGKKERKNYSLPLQS
jgi:hypothetical protein